jgi:hypothetical protein
VREVIHAGLRRDDDLSFLSQCARDLAAVETNQCNTSKRYYPSLKRLVDCLIAMEDVSSCFAGENWSYVWSEQTRKVKPSPDPLVCLLILVLHTVSRDQPCHNRVFTPRAGPVHQHDRMRRPRGSEHVVCGSCQRQLQTGDCSNEHSALVIVPMQT